MLWNFYKKQTKKDKELAEECKFMQICYTNFRFYLF